MVRQPGSHLKNLPGRHARARFGIFLKTSWPKLGPFIVFYRALTLFAVATLASCTRNPYLTMKLKRFLLRYYPRASSWSSSKLASSKKSVDLLTLTPETDGSTCQSGGTDGTPYLREPQAASAQAHSARREGRVIKTRLLPLQNPSLTFCSLPTVLSTSLATVSSPARTIDTSHEPLTGEELLTLEGHKNVVYAIAFNNPYGDKVTSAVNAAVGGRILPSRASHDQAAAPFPTLLPRAARRSLRVLSTRRRRYGTRKRVSCCTLCADTQPRLSACRSIRMA